MLKPATGLALEPADRVGVKPDDVLGTEIIDVARGGETDPRGRGTKADGKIEIAVEQAMDQPCDKRVSGADAVDDLYEVARCVTELAAGKKKRAGPRLRRPRQGDERDAIACGNRSGELFSSLGKAQHGLRVALGENQQVEMRRHQLEQLAYLRRRGQGRA